jgi:hypothetical protein
VGPNIVAVCIDENNVTASVPRKGEGHWLFAVGECDLEYDKNGFEVAPLSRLEGGRKATGN